MITDPFAPLAPTPAITTAAEARAAGRAAQDNREVPLHDITGHMYAIGVPRSLHYAYLGGIDDSLEDDGVDTTADPDANGYGWESKIGRTSCRERVGQSVQSQGVSVSFKQKHINK